jgi:hypothetical protein
MLDPESFTFTDVKTTAAISTFVISSESVARRVALDVPIEALSAGIASLGSDVARSTLSAARGWTQVVNNPSAMSDAVPTLGQVFHVHRGTATGANDFFVLEPNDAERRGLAKYAVPTVTRAKEIIDARGVLARRQEQKVVLSFPKTLDRKRDHVVDAFLSAGERPNVNGTIVSDGSNARKRSPWWSFAVFRPRLVVTYMGRRPPAFAANPERLGILNIAIGLEPKLEMDDAMLVQVAAALNEAAPSFETYAVRYFGNLRKFEPNTIALLPLPPALHFLIPTATLAP